jgi:hypothetical protein
MSVTRVKGEVAYRSHGGHKRRKKNDDWTSSKSWTKKSEDDC